MSAPTYTWFHGFARDAPALMWCSGADAMRRVFSHAWLELTGDIAGDEPDDAWVNRVPIQDRAVLADRVAHAARRREPFTAEYRVACADGHVRWMLERAQPWDGGAGFGGFLGTCIDITDRKQGELAVAEAERRFRHLLENAQDMVYRRRMPSRQVEYVGGAVEAITGHSPGEFYRDPDLTSRAVHPDDIALLADLMGDPRQIKEAVTLRWIHPDGRIVYAEHRRVPVFGPDGALIAIDGIARDVTARIDAYERLRESKDQLRRLAASVEAARENERAAIAREIHDELGQTLTALKLEMRRAVDLLRPGPAIDRLQSMIGLCEWSIESIHRIATLLRPATLDHLGLPDAIRWEAAAFRSRTNVRCRVVADSDATSLTVGQQTAVFRIFQEALRNVERHANASSVTVRLREDHDRFELAIHDNGRGVETRELSGPHALGILGMRERAELIGGAFEIDGGPRGTTVTVHVPAPPRIHPGTR